MTNHTSAPAEALGYSEANGLVVETTRKERAAKIRELKRQADASKERARKAQERYERAVVLTASTRPDREDWYEHPGELPRKQLLEAAKLNTMMLHRIMERYRKNHSTKKAKR